MLKRMKLNLYELSIEGIMYWQRTIDPETNEMVFVKHKMDSFTLFLDKLDNPKDLPQINGCYYLDMISGRLLSLSENENYIIIQPSNICIPKSNFTKGNGTFKKVSEVINHNEESYVSISEDVIFNSYFCDIISKRDGIDEVPYQKVRDEILESRKDYLATVPYDVRVCESSFSADDFMNLFCAINASFRTYSFNKDNLFNFIRLCKDNNQFVSLLSNIQFKSNGNFYYSDELDDAIIKLKLLKILYTTSSEHDHSLFISENISMSKLIENRHVYFDEMVSFLREFTDYESKQIEYEDDMVVTRKLNSI